MIIKQIEKTYFNSQMQKLSSIVILEFLVRFLKWLKLLMHHNTMTKIKPLTIQHSHPDLELQIYVHNSFFQTPLFSLVIYSFPRTFLIKILENLLLDAIAMMHFEQNKNI